MEIGEPLTLKEMLICRTLREGGKAMENQGKRKEESYGSCTLRDKEPFFSQFLTFYV